MIFGRFNGHVRGYKLTEIDVQQHEEAGIAQGIGRGKRKEKAQKN